MRDISPFTQDQWCQMVSSQMSMPVPLYEADLDKPFVYDRKWGVFYVTCGYHWMAMGTLLAFRNGYDDPFDYGRFLGLSGYNSLHELADKWILETEGTCFASSMDEETITVGKRGNLNAAEKLAMRNYPFRYVEDKS